MENYKHLQTQLLGDYHLAQHAKGQQLDLDSPAVEIMSNFSRTTPLMIDSEMPLDQAIVLMKSAHIGAALVIDHEENFAGVVSLTDLQSARVLSIATRLNLKRSELSVGDLMVNKHQFQVIQLQTVLNACIGDVLHTMKQMGLQHILVVAQSTMEIVGMISARDIAKTLRIPIQIEPLPQSFQDVMMAVGHP